MPRAGSEPVRAECLKNYTRSAKEARAEITSHVSAGFLSEKPTLGTAGA